ncbi:MAG: hypothetical protein HUN05_14560 [Desulfobacter sp.]|nr:MAG: hypothetical protein HUN05_14560 [Desulfobacter sp.]
MLSKNIFGTIILVLNIAGIGYVLYLVFLGLINKLFPKEEPQIELVLPVVKKKRPVVIDESIIPDEDDLLKDMDLSDLDDFE